MKRFEYMTVKQATFGNDMINVEYWFNQFGAQGWELCAIDWGHLIFKREIPSATA